MKEGTPPKSVNLVWTAPGLDEACWLRQLLAPMIRRETHAYKFEFVEPGTIYVVSVNQNLHRCIPPAFLAALAGVQGKGLIHLGDEYFAGGYDVYKHFDFVLRTYHIGVFDDVPEVLTIPLGWGEGLPQRSSVKPVNSRKYLWSFLGNQTAASRPEMFRALRQVEPKFVYTFVADLTKTKRLSPAEYHALLDDTAFVPCPMGNAIMETWRFYEALEAGCIPIIEVRPWMRYYERLLGPNPIPTVFRWSQAANLIKTLSKDSERLKALQQSVVNWWGQFKQSNQSRIQHFVTENLGRRDGRLSTRRLPATSPFWPMRQIIELLRHQSGMSLFRRMKRPFVRLVAK